jgi:hypothetical protein
MIPVAELQGKIVQNHGWVGRGSMMYFWMKMMKGAWRLKYSRKTSSRRCKVWLQQSTLDCTYLHVVFFF